MSQEALESIITPPPCLVQYLTETLCWHTFKKCTPLIYENQVPIVAYFIHKGTLEVKQQLKPLRIIKNGNLLGLSQTTYKSPFPAKVVATPGTTLYYLDRSTIVEIIRDKRDTQVANFLKSYISTI